MLASSPIGGRSLSHSPEDGGGPRRWEAWLFVLLIAAHLVPIWQTAYFPSQDGPSHIENANILRLYFLPEGERLHEYYELMRRPMPNVLGHLLMGLLLFVLPALLAEKVLLSGYVILLPLAVRYAVGAIRPQSRFLAFLVFPFLYNRLFQIGFYNFLYGLALMFFLVGYWIRSRRRLWGRAGLVLCLLALLLYLAHLAAVLPALLILSILGVWFAVADRREGSPEIRRQAAPQLAAMGLALLPAAALGGCELLHFATGTTGPPVRSLQEMVLRLLTLPVLVSQGRNEIWLAVGTAILVLAVAGYAAARRTTCRQLNRWDILLVVLAILTVQFFRARSEGFAEVFVPERMTLLVYLVLLLWLAAQTYETPVRRFVPVASAVIAIAFVGIYTVRFARIAPYLEEFVSVAGSVDRGATFLPVVFQPQGLDDGGNDLSLFVSPFLHAGGYVAAIRDAVDLGNYEAHTLQFQLRFRDGLDTFRAMPDLMADLSHPPVARIAEYEAQTGKRIDTVLVWGYGGSDAQRPASRVLMDHLRAHYELVTVSRPRGLMQVYRRKE